MGELISELCCEADSQNLIKGKTTKYKNGITKEEYELNNHKYFIIGTSNLVLSSISVKNSLINAISVVIKKLAASAKNVLIVGLGNRHISADSLGAETLKNIIATRNIVKSRVKVSAISTSVFGLTGIESADIVYSIKKHVKPDLVILVDSLCANSYKTIGNCFQITTQVLSPGRGVGNKRKSLDNILKSTNVISIGVPLVVYAKSFVFDAVNNTMHSIKKSNNIDIFNEFLKNDFNNLILTVKDVDLLSKVCGKIIGYAINKGLNNYSILMQKNIVQTY